MSQVTRIHSKQTFSLADARELLPVIRRITAQSMKEAQAMAAQYDALPEDHPKCDELEDKFSAIVDAWSEKIENLGGKAKGLWLVDFDNGAGYYCWRYPETEVDHFHDYESGFDARQQIN